MRFSESTKRKIETLDHVSIYVKVVQSIKENDTGRYIRHMRDTTNNFDSFNSSDAKSKSLVKRDARWTFVFEDWKTDQFPNEDLGVQVTFITMNEEDCCVVKNTKGGNYSTYIAYNIF